MNLKHFKIGIVGLGYVGLPLAVAFGKKRAVIGFDIKTDRIAELRAGFDRTFEVTELELGSAKNLYFTSDPNFLRGTGNLNTSKVGVDLGLHPDQVVESMVFIVTVPTPIDKSNRPDLSPLVNASETVGKALRRGDVVIFESTVYPGATEEICVPILERNSGLVFNDGFCVGYSPERINPGDKTRRLPDIKKVISASSAEATKAVNELYQEVVTAGTHIASSIRVAEAAKVIENSQRDLNIAFVNELSKIFNRIGIDTNEVLAAAATKWNFLPFKPGLVGGHCIGVDPYYLTHKAQELGYNCEVILSGRRINDSMASYAVSSVVQLMLNNGFDLTKSTVGVLGVTFKENCPDVRNSKVIDIIRDLKNFRITVKVADPCADSKDVYDQYGLHLEVLTPDCPVDSLIVAVAHDQFKTITPRELRHLCGDKYAPIIADLKSLYDPRELRAHGFTVYRF